jgi:hypothetical protein
MYPLVETYLQSGQKQKVFCESHALPEAVLNYWLSKYRRGHASSAKAFVEIAPPSPIGNAFLEIAYPDGLRLRFFTPVSPAYLAQLLP